MRSEHNSHNPMPLIQTQNLKKIYWEGKTQVQALRGVDLEIGQGEFTAIAGPSGSGKTTLLNLLGGLDTVSSGTIRLNGQEISALRPQALTELRLHQIGFVFQAFNLIPVLTARENVEFTMLLQGVPARTRKERALKILHRIGLADCANRRPAALSGGQQQRIAVARAIVTRPRLVLADEPTANLDSDNGARLLDLMRDLNAEHHTTFLFSTHDPMVMEYSRRLIRLHDGTIHSDQRVS